MWVAIIAGAILAFFIYAVTYWHRPILVQIHRIEPVEGTDYAYFHFRYGKVEAHLNGPKDKYKEGDRIWLINNLYRTNYPEDWRRWAVSQLFVLIAFVLYILYLLNIVSIIPFFVVIPLLVIWILYVNGRI